MIPIKSMTKEEIAEAAKAFADYTYEAGEHGGFIIITDTTKPMPLGRAQEKHHP